MTVFVADPCCPVDRVDDCPDCGRTVNWSVNLRCPDCGCIPDQLVACPQCGSLTNVSRTDTCDTCNTEVDPE